MRKEMMALRVAVFMVSNAVLGSKIVSAEPEKLIFDTDSAYFGDDGMALAMLLQRPDKASVESITMVAGNYAPLQGVVFMSHVLVMMGRRDIPIYMGACSPLVNCLQMAQEMKEKWGLLFMGAFDRPIPTTATLEPPSGGKFSGIIPQPEDAVDHIISKLQNSADPITIVALGPMTNLAKAIQKSPEIINNIAQLLFMGGNVHVPGNTTQNAEFNFWFDPEAAKFVLNAPIRKKVMIGLDITNQALLNKDHFDQLVATETPLAKLLMEDLRVNFPYILSNPGAARCMWDTLVAAYLIDPAIATRSEELYLDVNVEFDQYYGGVKIKNEHEIGDTPVQVLTGLDFDKFFSLLKESMESR